MIKIQNIFVDIDGVLTEEIEGWGDEIYAQRTPKIKMIRAINQLYSSGKFRITLFTARHTEDKIATEKWLKQNNVLYDDLILGKPHYDILIDDRAMKPDDFLHSMELLNDAI